MEPEEGGDNKETGQESGREDRRRKVLPKSDRAHADNRASIPGWTGRRKHLTGELACGAVAWSPGALPKGTRWLASFLGGRNSGLPPSRQLMSIAGTSASASDSRGFLEECPACGQVRVPCYAVGEGYFLKVTL